MSLDFFRHLLLVVLLSAAISPGREAGTTELPAPSFGEDTRTLVILPDTQYYSQKYPHHFEAQSRWIADHYETRNIVYTLHVGDIVQDDAPEEWQVATRCFRMLDGKVPFLLTPGNHDYSGEGRSTRLTEYFPVEKMQEWPTFGGVSEPGRLDNNYHLFRIGEQDWIALGLEFGPRKETMNWANKVLAEHSDRRAIIVTHAYLFYDNQRYDHRKGSQRATPFGYAGDGADGEQLWRSVVRKHPKVMMVVCGHVRTGGLGYRASEGDYGNIVHEMMANYQKMKGGGMGFLRLLEFHPNGSTVQVRTFSPSTGKVRRSELEEFRFELQGPTRSEPRPVGAVLPRPLEKPPIHRYSFGEKAGNDETLADGMGRLAGTLHPDEGEAGINDRGQLVLKNGGHATIPVAILRKRKSVTLEMWLAPTSDDYEWNSAVRFEEGEDVFHYTFRTLDTHRAELIDDGHNEDIQRPVQARVGEFLHIVMTYSETGAEGKPEIVSFINGEENGRMATSIKLSDLELSKGSIGPFEGIYEELRFYDYVLTPAEVANNFEAGPDQVRLEE